MKIESYLRMFEDYYRKKTSNRKLQWTLDFTRVRLQVTAVGNLKVIRCSGLCAVVFLLFNAAPVLSVPEMALHLKVDQATIEAILNFLRSKKGGGVLLGLHDKFRLNYDVSVENGVLMVPFRFPSLPKADDTAKLTIQQSRNSQLESVVMRIMKVEKSMEKQSLKVKVKELLTFRLEEELFENRLAHLAQNLYLKLDPSGRVHFLA
jgi:hypothetical protein